MNKTRTWMSGLLVCGATFALAGNLCADTTNRTVKVVRIVGTARYTYNNGASYTPVTTGTILKEGAILQTDKGIDSFVEVVIGDEKAVASTGSMQGGAGPRPGSAPPIGGTHKTQTGVDTIHLYPDTALSFDKLILTHTGAGPAVTDTELDLRKGHVTGNVKKMTAGSKYEIKYAKGVAGIRGSVYDMSVIEGIDNGTVTVTCTLNMLTGTAVLTYTSGGNPISVTVEPGQGFSTPVAGQQTFPVGLSPQLTAAIGETLAGMGVQGTIAVTIVAGNQNTIQQVTTTVGGP